jgi:hypothetical protein
MIVVGLRALLVTAAIAAPTVAAASGPPTGALHRIPGRSACISPATVASPCRHARHLQPTMLMSPDGRNVYTIGGVDNRSAIAVLVRDAKSGTLRQLRGRAGGGEA